MANMAIDWSLETRSLRKTLLKLSKPKLIKLCKKHKISYQGNKKEIIDRLLKSKPVLNKQNDSNNKKTNNKKNNNKNNKNKKKIKPETKSEQTTGTKIKCMDSNILSPKPSSTTPIKIKQTIIEEKSTTFVYGDDDTYLLWKKSRDIDNVPNDYQDDEEEYEDEEYEDDEELQAITIDHGSETIKSGLSGNDQPTNIIDSKIGIPNITNRGMLEYGFCKSIYDNYNNQQMIPDDVINIISKYYLQNIYIGDDLFLLKKILNITYPIQNGVVTNFDAMETLWHHIFFNQLHIDPEEHSVLLTYISNLSTKHNNEKTTQYMFECFNVPSMYMGIREVLSLYSYGRTTGMVLHCGHDISSAVSIYEGYALPHAIRTNQIAGKQITNCLDKLLKEKGYFLPLFIVQDIKEKLGYVTKDYYNDLKQFEKNGQDRNYKLPDGTIINIGSERLKCTEILFQSYEGIDCLAAESFSKCDCDIRIDLIRNVCISGGTSMLSNFKEIIQYKCGCKFPWGEAYYYTKVASSDKFKNKYSSWIGGSILSSLSTFSDMWITKDEYDESGPGIVHRKCF